MNFKQRETARIEAMKGPEMEAARNELIYQRIMRKIAVRESGCWEFMGARASIGYGVVSFNKKAIRAHRFMLERRLGASLGDLHACHHCDNPPCCNPDHLFAGDDKANLGDAAAKGLFFNGQKTHCPSGHEYSPENTYLTSYLVKGRRYQSRHCKRCGLIRMRMRAGWPRELAETLPSVGRGYTPVNAKWKRRKSKAA